MRNERVPTRNAAEAAFAAAAEPVHLEDLLEALRTSGALLIDGRSGSGKTSLGAALLRRARESGEHPQVLHVENLYPGWDGLAAGSRAVADALQTGEYRCWDWADDEYGDPVPLTSDRPLLIEGCGAVTPDNLRAAREWGARMAARDGGGACDDQRNPAPLEVRAVWLECPAALRQARAFARDGETFVPHWERWARQEDAHYAVHRPWELADLVLRTS